MKYAVIGYQESTNIGDEIQSIASANLLPSVDYYLPREGLNKAEVEENTKLICNGFFMHRPENWPPAKSIHPLFISFHVSKRTGADKTILDPKLKDYYEPFAPIGCRDYDTMRSFQAIGVDAYYSGCLTLTLGSLFPNLERTDKIYFVDAFTKYTEKQYVDRAIEHIVPEKYRDQIEFITHIHDRTMNNEEKIAYAKSLLKKYASAKLVVTSRIHCALPCLAFGTPVYFIDSGYSRKNFRNRFEGITDLMHVIDSSHFPFPDNTKVNKLIRRLVPANWLPWKKVKPVDFIDWENPAPNPVDIEPIKEKLIQTVRSFIQE